MLRRVENVSVSHKPNLFTKKEPIMLYVGAKIYHTFAKVHRDDYQTMLSWTVKYPCVSERSASARTGCSKIAGTGTTTISLPSRCTRSWSRATSAVLPGVAMIAVTFGLARYGYGLLLPDIRSDLGLSPGVAGVVGSAACLSYLVANVGVVWILNRLSVRWAVGIAAASAAVGMTVIATADALVLAAGVLVSGAAAGLAVPPYADLVTQGVPGRRGRHDGPARAAAATSDCGVHS